MANEPKSVTSGVKIPSDHVRTGINEPGLPPGLRPAIAECRIQTAKLKPEHYIPAAELLPTFREYMQLALYHPKFGYYSAAKVQFGKDFITYPIALSPNFGAMLAEHAFRMRG
jgi:hypothetical protein